MTGDIAFLSIDELGRHYRDRTLSPVEVTRLCLARVAEAEPRLNAIATVLEEPALAAAAAAEQELGQGFDRGPLHGVPVMVKDLFAVAGSPTRFGAHAAFTEHPAKDATLVAALRRDGAVLLAKTNMLEFAYGAVHPDVGQTNNPHDPGRTSGGSSGGSAAAVAAGLCYAAVGTDTGGSIRIPAAYCGIVGMKPTYGLVSLDGCLPLSWSLDHAGPLARSATDAMLLLNAMTDREFGLGALDLRGVRLGIVPAQRDAACLTDDVRKAFAAACGRLEAAGAVLVEVAVPELEFASEALMALLGPEAAVVHADRLASAPDAFGSITRAQIEAGFAVPAVAYVRAERLRVRLRAAFAVLFEQIDAVLSPTVPYVAPVEDPVMDPTADGAGVSDEMLFSAAANLTGCPALSLPCGMSPEGLPIGLHVTAGADRDAWLLALATAMAAALDPAVPPPASR